MLPRILTIVIVLLAIPLCAFAVSNLDPVPLRLWPFDGALVAPLSVAFLLFGAAAFLIGAAIVWLASLRFRARARRLERANDAMRSEIAVLRSRAVAPSTSQRVLASA